LKKPSRLRSLAYPCNNAPQLAVDGRRVAAEPLGDLADRGAGLHQAEEGATLIEVELAVGPGQRRLRRANPCKGWGFAPRDRTHRLRSGDERLGGGPALRATAEPAVRQGCPADLKDFPSSPARPRMSFMRPPGMASMVMCSMTLPLARTAAWTAAMVSSFGASHTHRKS
jgi:hypothetical protein